MLTLCTSLAPRLIRSDVGGEECGQSYQRACVESWQSFGYNIVSMNCEHELDWALEHFPDVGIIPSPAKAKSFQSIQPLPHIHDMVHAAAVQAQGPVCGLINSDIYLKKNLSESLHLHNCIQPMLRIIPNFTI